MTCHDRLGLEYATKWPKLKAKKIFQSWLASPDLSLLYHDMSWYFRVLDVMINWGQLRPYMSGHPFARRASRLRTWRVFQTYHTSHLNPKIKFQVPGAKNLYKKLRTWRVFQTYQLTSHLEFFQTYQSAKFCLQTYQCSHHLFTAAHVCLASPKSCTSPPKFM